MNTPILRSALESLRRDNERPHVPLRADAERAIRRRLGVRWAARGGSALAIGGVTLATVAGAWGGSGDDAPSPSPSPTPHLNLAAATFPLAGGPEFASPLDTIECGDPAPTAHPEDHDIALSVTLQPSEAEDPSTGSRYPDSAIATLEHTSDGYDGVAATSGVTVLAIRNGVVVGVGPTGLQLGWQLDGPAALSTEGWLAASSFLCPATDYGAEVRSAGLVDGPYQVVAVARVFSTPESVALSQVLGHQDAYGLDPMYLAGDDGAIYLPGSYECRSAQQNFAGSVPRGCLAGITDRASVNVDDLTATVLYNPEELVDEFSVELVSEPLDVVMGAPGGPVYADADFWEAFEAAAPASLESLAELKCGASWGSVSLGNDADTPVSALFTFSSGDTWADRGVVSAGIWATGVPDGTRVTMLPGAKMVMVRYDQIDIEVLGETQSTSATTEIGEATVTSDAMVVTDRFVGPQRVTLAYGVPTSCDGGPLVIRDDTALIIAATWLLETPDGRSLTVESTSEFVPSGTYIGTITS